MRRALVVVAALAVALALGAPPVEAAPPDFFSVVEVHDASLDRPMLLLFGYRLNSVKRVAAVRSSDEVEFELGIRSKAKDMLAVQFGSEAGPGPMEFTVTVFWGRTGSASHPATLRLGLAQPGSVPPDAITPEARTDLDDAATLGGNAPAYYLDPSHLSGPLPADKLTSTADLVTAGRIGTGFGQFVTGDIFDWAALTGKPATLASGIKSGYGISISNDGTIQVKVAPGLTFTDTYDLIIRTGSGIQVNQTTTELEAVFAGTGSDYGDANSVARSDHRHDARYPVRSELTQAGTVNATSNPVDWSQLKGVPAGIADGVDDAGVYSAGPGLTQSGTVFSANLTAIATDTGASTTVARGDHGHDGRYLKLSGGTLTGALIGTGAVFVTSSGIGVQGTTTANGAFGLFGSSTGSNNGIIESAAVRGSAGGSAKYGVYGTNSTASGIGVQGESSATSGVGVVGLASDTASATIGVSGTSASSTGFGGFFENTSTSGVSFAVTGKSQSTGGTGVLGRATSTTGTCYGVQGISDSSSGVGVFGEGTLLGVLGGAGTSGIGVKGLNSDGTAIQGLTGSGTAIHAISLTGTPLIAENSSSSGNLAVFQSSSQNKARIDSSGKGFFNGGTQNSGADVAESVVATDHEALGSGDVLVIDPSAPRRFARSSAAESPLVAGVYATKPGVLLRNGDVTEGIPAEEVPLAVVGIVPCKVCDEGGPIAIGDLLVTSSKPGHARKAPANARQGTLLGKALGALDRGNGTVEILLMAR